MDPQWYKTLANSVIFRTNKDMKTDSTVLQTERSECTFSKRKFTFLTPSYHVTVYQKNYQTMELK